MAEPKIGSLQERKARLLMESDTLRYNLQLQRDDMAALSRVFTQGVQVSRLGASLFRFASSFRNKKSRRKNFSLPRLIFGLIRMH